jgi:hypothetical protein
MAAKKKASKEQLAAREFATLYVNGPTGLKLDWAAVEHKLGRKFATNDPLIREAIYAEGGALPDMMPSTISAGEVNFKLFDPSILREDRSESEWLSLAEELEATMMGIAKGDVKASAAQVSILKEILARAHGKIGQQEKKTITPSGVIILPTLGERSAMAICPRCRYQVEQLYPKEGSAANAEANLEVAERRASADRGTAVGATGEGAG